MTKRFLVTQRFVNLSTDPASGSSGEIYFNNSTNELKVYSGSAWSSIGSGSGGGSGTVTSVGLSVPTGLSVSNTPITSSGTIALTLTAGYSIPTTSSQSNWDTAYTDRNKWDGGDTGLVAATGRTSLGLGTMATAAASDYAALSGATFTGAVVLAADPLTSLGAATKQYVDAVAQGLHVHASAATATTVNINLSSPPAAIDGVTLTDTMRVLVKDQSTTSQNGIYVYSTSTGQLSRASDFDSAAEIDGGDFVFVTGGTINNDTGWVQTETVITIGTDPIIFTQFSGAGTYTAGTGLSLTGSQFANTGVLSVNGNSGTITGIATLASPTFTGTPLAPTATAGTNTTQIATTAFVSSAVAAGGSSSTIHSMFIIGGV